MSKRDFSQISDFTTQESVFSMPGLKKQRGSKSSSKAVVPFKRYKQPTTWNRVILSQTVDYDADLTTDVSHGFGFTGSNLFVNGVATVTYDDASTLSALFDQVRVHKVEMTIRPAANQLSYNDQGLSSGQTNIPWGYCSFDYNSGSNPSLASIRQYSDCKTFMLDRMYKRTCYPRISNGNTTDMGSNRKDVFAPIAGTAPWYGILVYLDLAHEVWTYGTVRFSFKVYLELTNSR